MKYIDNNFEIIGKQYLDGVGGYDGTNPNTNNDVATVLPNMVEITYSELVELRDSSKLIPGQQYRITDYVTTTTQSDTQSAGHQFDIIVTADSENTLNELARAYVEQFNIDNYMDAYSITWSDSMTYQGTHVHKNKTYHMYEGGGLYVLIDFNDIEYLERDVNDDEMWDEYLYQVIPSYYTQDEEEWRVGNTSETISFKHPIVGDYFKDSKLEAWQIWYSLDNDVERFDWADAENGKGVIYRMIDEFGNDCPYDFKNILFKRYKTTSNHEAFEDDKTLIEDYLGIKNLGGADLTMPSLFTIPSESDYTWYYTFNSLSGTEDITLSGNKVRLNTIERGLNFNTKKHSLNNIVLRTNWALKTHTFANDCFNTTIIAQNGQESSWDNVFGQYCRGNVIVVNNNYAQNNFNRNFHTNCIVITNDGGLYSNNFGGYAQRNIIKTNLFMFNNINVDFKSNQIYSAFGDNTIGVSATGNTISANFAYNQINNFFEDNTINGAMFRNIIGDTFKANTINDSPSGGFRQTTIGVGASGNTLTGILNCNIGQLFLDNNISYMSASKIGAGFRNNYFKQDANLSSADRPYVQGCTFGDYVWFNNFYNATTAAENTPIACLRVQSYLQGQSATNPNHIQIPLSPNKSEITVAKNSDGVIKVYNTTN